MKTGLLFFAIAISAGAQQVATPFGPIDAGCVHRLGPGELIGDELAPCGAARAQTTTQGWVEDYALSTDYKIGAISAEWIVPKTPAKVRGQIIYLFPGLMDSENPLTIAQPVLSFGGDIAGAWTIAAWDCCKSGNVFESQFVRVYPGDLIHGTIQVWTPSLMTITIEDVTRKKHVALDQAPIFAQSFDLAFAGAIEAYGVSECSEYPAQPAQFSSVKLYDKNIHRRTVRPFSWSYNQHGNLARCGYSGQTPNPETVKLNY